MLKQDLNNLQDLLSQVANLADEISLNIDGDLYKEDYIDIYQQEKLGEYIINLQAKISDLQDEFPWF